MEIRFDPSVRTKPTDRSWQMCVGSDHAFQLHRADFQQQMAYVRQELGFRYIRFHGIFDDDMNIIQSLSDVLSLPGAQEIRTTDFFQVGKVYDAVLKAGLKPFVELGFMPSALASGKKTAFHYKGNVTPPKDPAAWAEFIRQFIRFLLDRYGELEVESWYFEVWNEPDLSFFWSGRKKGYFELYKTTVQAIKAVNSRLRVGGPATSSNRWIKEFKAYCLSEGLPLDFISSHHYPGDVLGHRFDANRLQEWIEMIRQSKGEGVGAVSRKLFWNPGDLPLIPKGILTQQLKAARKKAGSIPLMYTEWNVSATYGAPVHDTRLAAAFALKTVLDSAGLVEAYSFWCFSDLFEEMLFLTQPFNGGFGLLTVDGIPKPNFWAFKMLSMLGDERYLFHFEQDGVEAAAFKKDDQLQILLYQQNLVEEDTEKKSIQLVVSGIEGIKRVTVQAIDNEFCNPMRAWEEMGSPSPLKPHEVEQIKAQSCLTEVELPFEDENHSLLVQTALGVNDIKLITLER